MVPSLREKGENPLL